MLTFFLSRFLSKSHNMCYSDYTACIFGSIWSIVQSLLHLIWCVWGVYLYECKYDLSTKSFTYFWYLTYFYTNTCINATFNYTKIPSRTLDFLLITPKHKYHAIRQAVLFTQRAASTIKAVSHIVPVSTDPPIEFPPESATASRTYSILSAYCVFDAVWVCAATLLLIGSGHRIRGFLSLPFFFPWPVILLIIIIFDGITSSWYASDIVATYGITNWFLFIGAQNQSVFEQLETQYPKMSSTIPSILMFFLFSRFIFIWFINVFLFFRIVHASVNAYQGIEDDDDVDDDDETYTSEND